MEKSKLRFTKFDLKCLMIVTNEKYEVYYD